jgi:hypothetical protein
MRPHSADFSKKVTSVFAAKIGNLRTASLYLPKPGAIESYDHEPALKPKKKKKSRVYHAL